MENHDQIVIETPRENWSKFPNSYLDNLHLFDPYETQAFCLVVRNASYTKPNHRFSARYVALKTGMGKNKAHDSMQELVRKGALTQHESPKGLPAKYSIRWQVSPNKGQSPAIGVPPQGTVVSLHEGQEKDHYSKTTKKRKMVARAEPSLPSMPSPHSEVMAHYSSTYQKMASSKPIINGKQGSAVKNLLKSRTSVEINRQLDRLQELCSSSREGRFFTFDICLLEKQWAKIDTRMAALDAEFLADNPLPDNLT